MPIIVSTHPRTQKRIDALDTKLHSLIQLLKPLGFKDYNKLQISAKAVLSDSGTINEESSIMNFPALNLREAHERPEGMDEGTLIMSGLEKERVLESIKSQLRGSKRSIKQVYDYSVNHHYIHKSNTVNSIRKYI